MMKQLVNCLILICVLAFAGALAMAGEISRQTPYESPVAPDQQRGVEQTFLTFPEWFLVHSPAEYATYVSAHPSHEFPFLSHIGQLWSSYGSVIGEQVRANYPKNGGYHVMICVIAGSTTIEYAVHSAYENALGRISWAIGSGELTAEDRYGAAVAQDYVDFIRQETWYLYDFTSKLESLWSGTPLWGHDMPRKWERRYALTTEYVVKAVYGKMIEWATRAAYTPALMTTDVVVDHAPAAASLPPKTRVLQVLKDGRAVLEMPRYFDFHLAATQLANQNVHLVDIAGNTSVILITVIGADNINIKENGGRILFEQPMITTPGRKRTALVLPVGELSAFLANSVQRQIQVEHVYDY